MRCDVDCFHFFVVQLVRAGKNVERLELASGEKTQRKIFLLLQFFFSVDILRSYINISLDFPFQTT